VNETVQLGF